MVKKLRNANNVISKSNETLKQLLRDMVVSSS